MMSEVTAKLQEIATDAKAWPFVEARALASRMEKLDGAKDEVLFETGYGPSGLPHIGTFGEVVRTTMVRHAYEALTGQKTRLICFSDDMDGFRKIPDNVPNHEMLVTYLDLPMTKEKDIQIACNDYLNYLSNSFFFRHFHVPNEGKKTVQYHALMKLSLIHISEPTRPY